MTLDIVKAEKGMDIARNYDLTLLQSPDIDDETGFITKLEFAVGQIYEPAAGINGGAVSPWFLNATDAYAWCADNEAFLDGMFGDKADDGITIRGLTLEAALDEPMPRQAQCTYCKRIVEVNDRNRLQFIITPRPDWDRDQMDCGCRGW